MLTSARNIDVTVIMVRGSEQETAVNVQYKNLLVKHISVSLLCKYVPNTMLTHWLFSNIAG